VTFYLQNGSFGCVGFLFLQESNGIKPLSAVIAFKPIPPSSPITIPIKLLPTERPPDNAPVATSNITVFTLFNQHLLSQL